MPARFKRRDLNQLSLYSVAALFLCVAAPPSHAQVTAPSQVTPDNLRPEQGPPSPSLRLPGAGAATLPAGDNSLSVIVDRLDVSGEFAELAAASRRIAAALVGHRVTVREIFAAAAELEHAYFDAGFPLVRVAVPPQRLIDHCRLRLVVIDGYIEAVDASGVDARVRRVVETRTAGLIGQRHLRLATLERALLIAGDIPGMKLVSTLDRGASEGGARLILEGEHRLVSGSAGFDNRLTQPLGIWQLRGTIGLNGAFGFGEQIYATGGSGADLGLVVDGRSPLVIYGGGVVIPLGADGLTVNPEYTHSTTRNPASPGVPASLGTFDRTALRLRDPVQLTRTASIYGNLSLELIDQQLLASDFAVLLNHDHYGVLRLGPDVSTGLPWGAGLALGGLLSIGLGGRSLSDAVVSKVPLSRAGASPEFTKLTITARLSQPLPAGLRLDLIGAGQSSFGAPMMRPEQIALDGTDALSAFASGTFSADQGAVLRSELARPFALPLSLGNIAVTAVPYLFGAVGRGWLMNATAVEQAVFNAESVGVGLRTSIEPKAGLPAGSIALEAARGFTDLAGARPGWRANLVASVVF